MNSFILKGIGVIIAIAAFGIFALYSNKILNRVATSKNIVNKWYFKVFGKSVKRFQEQFSRTAKLNKGTLSYKLYHFFDDIILNLDMRKDNVTVAGLIVFVVSVSVIVGLVISYFMASFSMLFPIIAAMIYLIIVILRFIGLTQFEKKEGEIMDAVDLLVSDVRGGIYNAVLKYKDSFSPNIRPYFSSFIDDIQNKGYSFRQAIGILNDNLGYNFTDFAQKAIIYEEKADKTMEDIFSNIVETNRMRRTLRDINNKKFMELRTQFIVSFLLIVGYGVLSILLDPFIFNFLTGNFFGKMLVVLDIVIVAFVLSYLVKIKAKTL